MKSELCFIQKPKEGGCFVMSISRCGYRQNIEVSIGRSELYDLLALCNKFIALKDQITEKIMDEVIDYD